MIEKITDNIYTFPIELPQNPLKWLNCYVIKSGGIGRNLLIDTGFNRSECSEALLAGMRELELKPEETDVFLTHFHADHSGNAGLLQSLGCRIIMGRVDYEHMLGYRRIDLRRQMLREGMPQEIMADVFDHNPAAIYVSGPFTADTVEDGEVLCYGGCRLQCIAAPGHTLGHMCLYDSDHGLIFLGDHVLFDITPNICSNGRIPDILGIYMNSLRRVQALGNLRCLPAHRGMGNQSLSERVETLIAHHEARIAEAEEIVKAEPGLTAYEITGKMHWHIRARNWDDFPPGQKVFAIGEAIAHLDALIARNRITRTTDDAGLVRYY